MSNIFGTNTTSDLMSVAETAQKIMQGKSLTEDWLEAEMRKVQHKWPRTNPKIKQQWLKKITARAEKEGMDTGPKSVFIDRLDDYELTVHADDKVWTEASKIKSKWKKMSTAERTRWLDKIDDLARKQNTSDEDVRAIRDEFGLHMSEEVEVAEAVLADRDYEYDGKVIKISKKNFSKVPNDYKNSTKGKERMITYDDKAGTVSVPVQFTEEVEMDEEFWAVIDKAKGGEVMAITSDEKGAKSSVKMSNFSKHDYHFGKDPRTLKIVKVMGKLGQKTAEKMIGTKLSFKEEVAEAKGTAYPATIDTLKMIVKDKQNQIVMFKSGQARVDSFTASAMVAVYDAMKPATKKKFEEMIKDKGGFMKTQAFAMKMTEDAKWIDQIKEDPSMLELHYNLVEITEAVHDKKSTFTMAPFEDLRSVADAALQVMTRNRQEVKEEEVTKEEPPQKLTEEIV
jgi:hypothetical protein